MTQCQKSFDHLRELLMEYPILRYPDPQKSYTVFTDASGIGWSGVLTQEYEDKKGRLKHHPICYVSGQFRGSQLKLGSTHQRGIRHLHVDSLISLLHIRSGCYHKMRPPPFEEVFDEKDDERESEQLGC